MNYNLLMESWIPVLWADGKTGRVGIMEALRQAHRIRQVAASNPMDRLAVFRFLLALLYWCQGNPPDDVNTHVGEALPPDWFSKLEEHRECFNLLGEGKRFYQYRKSGDSKDTRLSANYLVQEVPTGTNIWHFRHATDGADGLCPACCTMGLLRLPLFATSGGRGKPPGVNSKPPIYVIPMGDSLAASLQLSWLRVSQMGNPAWETPDIRLPKEGEIPLLMGLTWLPRRVWLDTPSEFAAPCVSCGRIDHLIRLAVFAPIGSTKTAEDAPARKWSDPHVIYSVLAKGETASLHAADALGASDAAAGQWARIMAGVLQRQEVSGTRRLWVVGFSTVKNDKYLDAMECSLPYLPSSHPDQASFAKCKQWFKETTTPRGLARKMWPIEEHRSSIKHVEIPPALAAIRPHVEHRVSAKADELISGNEDTWLQAAAEYRPMMKIIAKSLAPGFTTSALQRRRQIAEVKPDMRSESGAVKKPRRRKGGDA